MTKDMGAINHHIKYFKNQSFCEEAEVIIIHLCSIKDQLDVWNLP